MLYPKILAPFRRHESGAERGRLIRGDWMCPEFEALKDMDWEWTEKVDGTNVRVLWDGYKVRFGGRTEDAQMYIPLLDKLSLLFVQELLEQQFGRNPALLVGEGYGAKVADGGGKYRGDPGFVLFDVCIDGWWLRRPDVESVATGLGLHCVPVVMHGPIAAAINRVSTRALLSQWGDFEAEGLVGKAPLGMLTRGGERIMVKVKAKDFKI
jgi:hypothetical protein